MGRKLTNSPKKKTTKSGGQNYIASQPPKRWWNVILETNKIIAAGTVGGAFIALLVGWWLWHEQHVANLAAWEEERAHLQIPDSPVSSIKATSIYGSKESDIPTGLVEGTVYVNNRGPTEALNAFLQIAVTIQPRNGREIKSINSPVGLATPGTIAKDSPPVVFKIAARFRSVDWIQLVSRGGYIHIRVAADFDDVHGMHIEKRDIEARLFWQRGWFENPKGWDVVHSGPRLP